jgi:dihydrofolate reductase
MGNAVIDMSMSLDGYIAAPNDNPEQGLGEDGMAPQLGVRRPFGVRTGLRGPHARDGRGDHGPPLVRQLDRGVGRQGPARRVPCFVVTHRPLEPPDPLFTVTDGIESALAKAQEAAGEKRIGLMGANLDQQFLAAGLVDEIRIHVIDVLLGGGLRLFDELPQRIELEQTGVTQTGGVTHLEYRVVR